MNKFELNNPKMNQYLPFPSIFHSGYLVALATKLYLDHMLFKVWKMFLQIANQRFVSQCLDGSWHKLLSNIHSFNVTLSDVFTRWHEFFVYGRNNLTKQLT